MGRVLARLFLYKIILSLMSKRLYVKKVTSSESKITY